MTTILEQFGMGTPGKLCHKDFFIAGVECEIERVLNPEHTAYFHVTNDGSLRHNGYEFISHPLDRPHLVEAFKDLHKKLQFEKDEDPFSIRTSTHVHVNCVALKLEEVRTLVLLYALFEEFFFMMVKKARRDNIHCVPLTETALPAIYKQALPHYIKHWSKYTALNLKRLTDLGTVEFRHLHGTNDPVEFDTWLAVLEILWNMAQRVEINEKTLTDKAQIVAWFEELFAPVDYILAFRPTLFEIIRNNLIDVKFSV